MPHSKQTIHCCRCKSTLNGQLSTDDSSERFWISRLKNTKNAKLLCKAFDNMTDGICKEATQLPSGQRPEAINIEMLDMTITAMMQCGLEMAVGTYHPNSSKPQRSTINAKEHTLADITRAIKSNKRELGRTTPLRHKNPNLTPMQEAEQYYTSLFSIGSSADHHQ